MRKEGGSFLSKVVAVANQKGGVGKTTTTVNLASCVAEKGKRVLLVDMDPQGNATSGVGIDHGQVEKSIYDVLLDDLPVQCKKPLCASFQHTAGRGRN